VPDENGVKGTEEIVRLLRDAGDDTLVVCLISGGGSALLVSPSEGISLAEKQELTGLLLRSGADIYELKHRQETHLPGEGRKACRDSLSGTRHLSDHIGCNW